MAAVPLIAVEGGGLACTTITYRTVPLKGLVCLVISVISLSRASKVNHSSSITNSTSSQLGTRMKVRQCNQFAQ